MPTHPFKLDALVAALLTADPDAKAVLLVIVHPDKLVEPVYAARKGEDMDSFVNLADVLRNAADKIEAAHKAADGELP